MELTQICRQKNSFNFPLSLAIPVNKTTGRKTLFY
jgi:hypothetical protein